MQWLGFGLRPAPASRLSTAIKTLGLRSVVPLASSSRFLLDPVQEPPNHAEVRSSYFSCLLRIPYFRAMGNFGEPHSSTARPNRSQVRVSARAGCNKAETVENLWNGRQPDLPGKAVAPGTGRGQAPPTDPESPTKSRFCQEI